MYVEIDECSVYTASGSRDCSRVLQDCMCDIIEYLERIFICKWLRVCIYICVHITLCRYVRMCVCMHAYIWLDIYEYMHMYEGMYIRVCAL